MGAADKLFSRMQATKSGWGEQDFETLYLGFGFQFKESARHRLYFHPKYPQLFATVGRHKSLAKGYANTAVKLITQLKILESSDE